jgi:ABC-type transport system involved in cytochrome c biogenesis permease component
MAENFICDPRLLLNMTENNTMYLVNVGGCCIDWTVYIPVFLIVGAWLLFLYMAETRKDIGYAFFMLCVSTLAFSDATLSAVSATNGVISVNLPVLMLFISGYEMVMVFLLMREMTNRKNGDDGE